MKKKSVLPLVLCLQCLCAQAGNPHHEPATLNVLVENDGIAATDHHYTSGLEISWLSAPLSRDSPASRLAEWLPGNDGGRVRAGWQFGQVIFTPGDKVAEELIPDERPYAAWLYGGASIVYATAGHVDTWSVLLGTVGPHALGEPLQDAVHEWLHFREFRGWDNQVGNRIGGSLIIERKWRAFPRARIGRFDADLLPHAGLSLGNIETYASAGFTFRVGDDLGTDFGPPRIRPSVPGSAWFVPRDELAWYVFAGADARYVERNVFLDDNELAPSLEIDKERSVMDIQAGFVLTRGDFRLACTFVQRSKEYEQQSHPDRFGSIGLTWRF